jgi:hypothetical protein
MVKLAIAGAVIGTLAACQGESDRRAAGSGSAPEPRDAGAPEARDAGAPVAPEEPTSDAAVVEDPDPPDPGKLIESLGAVSAWQAVVDRGQYLARRGQQGVVFGTLGAPILVAGPAAPGGIDGGLVASGYTWLVDDTEGNGALAIRVLLESRTAKQGDRVALGGAWELDDSRRYYWKVASVTALPAAPPGDLKDPPVAPGHEIADGGVPAGARTISVARDDDLVYFTVVGKPPVVDGEGWPVADELGDPVFALLNLPGERPSYGGQDFRTPDERWQLKRGQLYWVRIGRIRRPQGPDKPALINARTAPVRVK